MKRSYLNLAGARCHWPTRVPWSATFDELGRDDFYVWGRFAYAMGSAAISWALTDDVFHTRGYILNERYFDRSGRGHGLEIERKKDGSVEWQVPWVRGHMHGLARQFNRNGKELFRTRFVRGSGVDLYHSGCELSELRMFRNDERHGVERWGNPRFPHEESHFLRGKRAGVFREWEGSNLKDGFPLYFVDDREVTRAGYLRARRSRPELPPDDRRDDRRTRPLHPSLRRVWLRKDLRAGVQGDPTTGPTR